MNITREQWIDFIMQIWRDTGYMGFPTLLGDILYDINSEVYEKTVNPEIIRVLQEAFDPEKQD